VLSLVRKLSTPVTFDCRKSLLQNRETGEAIRAWVVWLGVRIRLASLLCASIRNSSSVMESRYAARLS
jgi:hypothetical protein